MFNKNKQTRRKKKGVHCIKGNLLWCISLSKCLHQSDQIKFSHIRWLHHREISRLSRLSNQRNFIFFTSELDHVCHIREISCFSHQNYITFVTSEKFHICMFVTPEKFHVFHIRIISRLSHQRNFTFVTSE